MQAVRGFKGRAAKIYQSRFKLHVVAARVVLLAFVVTMLGRGLFATLSDAAVGVRWVAGKIAGCN